MTRDDYARAMCCRDGPCKHDPCQRDTMQLIPIHIAADIAHALHQRHTATLCERWREWPRNSGPLSRTTVYGGDEG